MCSAAIAENSSIATTHRAGRSCSAETTVCRSCTIAAPEHLREQRPRVGAEAEVHHRPLAHGIQQLEGLRPRRGGVEPRADVGLGHDREAVAHAAQIAALTGVSESR